ncbi:hypothetical protein [Vibrio campbellii]|uniref:hypothetical protein n=1 Tax=Vibrio campbellii TaxID=680 RepID=UPI000CD36CFA|nr:hypothetical protein [Vibrio campbellii]AUW07374.1 hypothetical protein C1N51_27305 [Vibrio campbellii]
MKRLVLISLLLSANAFAGINQSVRSNDLDCFVDVDDPFEMYVEGVNSQYNSDNDDHNNYWNNNYRDDKQVRIGIKYKFGSGIKPIDCDSLFQVELRKKEIELERLRSALENMKALDSLQSLGNELPAL